MTPPSPPPRRRRIRKWVVRSLLVLLLVLSLAYVLCTGPRDLALYPPAAESPYRLPWPAGESHLCVQGNRGVVSHRGFEEFAYDFTMPVGSDVLASRGGVVQRIEVSHDGHGFDMPNNLIIIDHGDGTRGCYLHLRQGGSYVAAGDRIVQGQRIAASGHVGRSMLPHLHFHVVNGKGDTLPISFAEVGSDRGVPRMGRTYLSRNQLLPGAPLH
jgi:murein DD-endopeptidase MepM/ murein hydrolase activator NlpD